MKKLTLLLFVFLAFTTISNAQGKFGLGVILGEPTGVSGKLKLSQSSAIDGAVGLSFYKYSSLHIHADYLQNVTNIGNQVPLYIGIGGRIKMRNTDKGEDLRLAARVPIGIVYEPTATPIDIFLEVVPMLEITPEVNINWNSAIGLRFYLN